MQKEEKTKISDQELQKLQSLNKLLEKDRGAPKYTGRGGSASVGGNVSVAHSVNRVGFPKRGYKDDDKVQTRQELTSSLSRRDDIRTTDSKSIMSTTTGSGPSGKADNVDSLGSKSMHGRVEGGSGMKNVTGGGTFWKSFHLATLASSPSVSVASSKLDDLGSHSMHGRLEHVSVNTRGHEDQIKASMNTRRHADRRQQVAKATMKLRSLNKLLEKDGGAPKYRGGSASVGGNASVAHSVNRVGIPVGGYKDQTCQELTSSLSRRDDIRTTDSKNIMSTMTGSGPSGKADNVDLIGSKNMHGRVEGGSGANNTVGGGGGTFWKSFHLPSSSSSSLSTASSKMNGLGSQSMHGRLEQMSPNTRGRQSESSDDRSIILAPRSVHAMYYKTPTDNLFSSATLRKKKERDAASVLSETKNGSGRRHRQLSMASGGGGSDASSVGGKNNHRSLCRRRRASLSSAVPSTRDPGVSKNDNNRTEIGGSVEKIVIGVSKSSSLDDKRATIGTSLADIRQQVVAQQVKDDDTANDCGMEKVPSSLSGLYSARDLMKRPLSLEDPTGRNTSSSRDTANIPTKKKYIDTASPDGKGITASEHGTRATIRLVTGDLSHLAGSSLADMRQKAVARQTSAKGAAIVAERKDALTEAPTASRRGIFSRMTLPSATLNALAAIKKRSGRSKRVPRRSVSDSATNGLDLERSTVENEQTHRGKMALMSPVIEGKEQGHNSTETRNMSGSQRSATESKPKRKSSIATKSRTSSERSTTGSKQSGRRSIPGRSNSEENMKKSFPPDTKNPGRHKGRGRSRSTQRSSSSRKSDEQSTKAPASKLPPETKSLLVRRERGRSKSVQRNVSNHQSDGQVSDSKLPPETKATKRPGHGRSASAQRSSSKSDEKALPPETKAMDRHGRGRSKSVQRSRSSNISDENDDNKLPPETKRRKRPVRHRSLSTPRGKKSGERRKRDVSTHAISLDEPSEKVEVSAEKAPATRRKERRHSASQGNVLTKAASSVAGAFRKMVADHGNSPSGLNASIADLDDTSPDAQLMKTLKTFEQLTSVAITTK